MPKVLLDTDILSEYLKGHDEVVARHAAEYARQHGAFTFTSVTVHEIVFGLAFKGASAQLEKAMKRRSSRLLHGNKAPFWNCRIA
jgi:tRNA(fMet)-specific endonuclease VapC